MALYQAMSIYTLLDRHALHLSPWMLLTDGTQGKCCDILLMASQLWQVHISQLCFLKSYLHCHSLKWNLFSKLHCLSLCEFHSTSVSKYTSAFFHWCLFGSYLNAPSLVLDLISSFPVQRAVILVLVKMSCSIFGRGPWCSGGSGEEIRWAGEEGFAFKRFVNASHSFTSCRFTGWVSFLSLCLLPLWFAQSRKNEGEKLYSVQSGANSCKWRNMCLLCDDSMLLLKRLKTLLCVYSILAGHICYSFQLVYVMWFIISIEKHNVESLSWKITHSSHYLHASACVERCGRALMESSEKDLMG